MASSKRVDAETSLPRRTRERILESEISWISAMALFFCTVYSLLKFDILWVFFGITALSLYVLPIVTFRDPFRALPWEMTLLLAVPILLHISAQSRSLNEHLSWWDDLSSVAFALSTATIGFLFTVELEIYTPVRMNRPFAVFFVIVFTLAMAGFWQIGEFVGDRLYGTHYQGNNKDVMLTLFWNLVGGFIMGFVYALYMRAMSEKRRATLGFIHLYEVHKW